MIIGKIVLGRNLNISYIKRAVKSCGMPTPHSETVKEFIKFKRAARKECKTAKER